MGKSVCVIGLGPGGISALKELTEVGLHAVGFDGNSTFGGRWRDGNASGIWEELTLNSDRRTTEFTSFPWNREDYIGKPGVLPDYMGIFPNQSEYKEYLKAYVKHFGLEKHMRLETAIKSVEICNDGGWNVTIQAGGKQSEILHFDYLVPCTARHNKPVHPLKEMIENNFSGTVIHTEGIKSLKDFQSKQVLVIGSSVSGSDTSVVLAKQGKCTSLVNSVRRVPYHISRISQTQRCSTFDVFFQRFTVWLARTLPDSIGIRGFQAALLEQFPEQITAEISGSKDLVPDPDIRKAGTGYTSDYVELLKAGKLVLKPEVANISGNTVTFKDGSKHNFDVIICGTGYEIDLSYLPSEIQGNLEYINPNNGTKEVKLYKHTWPEGVEDLAFVGTANLIGSFIPVLELQARFIAAVWSNKIKKPTPEAIKAGIKKFQDYRSYGSHNNLDVSPMVSEDIADDMGLTPGYFEALFNPRSLLFAPIFPIYYRTKDNDKMIAEAAQKRFHEYISHPLVAPKK